MKTFHFLKNKYGAEILMDIGKYDDIPAYYFEDNLHTTDFYEIVFFLKGNGYLELDHQQIKLRNHTILFLSPYQKRRWFLDKSKIDCYFLLFQDGFLSSFFSDKLFTYKLQFFYNKSNPLFIQPTPEFTNQLHSLLRDLHTEIRHYRPDSEHMTRSILYYILIKLNRAYAAEYQLSSQMESNTIAFAFKKLVQEQIEKQRGIDFYARKLGISRVSLNAIIKKQFGITVSEMIQEYILVEIKSKLSYTSLSVKEIADQLNFSEPHHLSRFFKKRTGLSPKDFRTTYQNGRSVS
ncbi:AraC family transcriptional regulator [Flavihumibacter sp. RY-1]|uniref:AraC family transcriptional regulator n=1 Tax=Flavihumibacter fluminis TaxID=2909236 RepID=A0ABS9BCB3_9BACT|nr:helix-turn-helix domain-containing protein [Flavihumibacter fluminis]MCF1713263.1 AraC family transcriptional regulator [Flavihumibacter fluminis]